MSFHRTPFIFLLMRKDKFLCPLVEAEVYHGNKGDDVTNRKDDGEGE